MPLTAKGVESAKPRPGAKVTKLSDGGGLQLWITPTGSKLWRLAYRFGGKQKLVAIGAYPLISLKEARERRDEHRKVLERGRDPSVERKVRASNTFNVVADDYLAWMKSVGRAEATIAKNSWLIDMARPSLGPRPISEIDSGDVFAVLKGIEARGKRESARRARAVIGAVFRRGIAEGKVTADPTVALQRQLAAPEVTPRAALLTRSEFGALLRAIDGMDEQPITRAALRLCALLAPRPGELRLAEWGEFDLDAAVWSIPKGRMKMRRPHVVPLSPLAIEVLLDLRKITGKGRFLFPSTRGPDRAMSDGTLNAALRRLGFTKDQATSHGFRASFSTFANEAKTTDAEGRPQVRMWDADAIERQLAHGDEDEIRGAYNRSPYWEERVRLMTWWAAECAAMARGAEVLQFARSA